MQSPQETEVGNDYNMVALWLRVDPKRWIAGALAGLFAGIVMLAFSTIIATLYGAEPWFAIKIAALPILGNSATAFGVNSGLFVGFIVHEILAAILGAVYAHFTGTNYLPALLGAGVVVALFSWIFIFNLFIQSFKPINAAHLSPAASLPVFLVFGLSLTSVAFFDRMISGRR